ncbi:MAG: hypothetical protein ACP5JF_00020 [Candidatus Methanodesulfokora sp.]
MKAVTWALLIIIGILLASFFVFIRPAFLRSVLRDQARDIAQYVAGQISFMARMADQGVIEGWRSFRVDAGSNKLVEIVVTYDSNAKGGSVIVRVTSENVYGQASANYTSYYLVRAPPKIYQGDIIISFNSTSAVITLANIRSRS